MSDFAPLSLKYRPQRFSDAIGQEFAVKVLKRSILEGKAYPSLVLYGHFGSGKTTLARLYAKALNCENVKDGEPCCECDSCKSITAGRSMVYHELDAASHGQVEHMRKLGEMISFKPLGKYRVITLDECHAATSHAWNAMLKYVEEPPPNVVFIFVTTEVEKIPDTILSRCFAIPFRGVSALEVVSRLDQIAQAEGIKVASPEVLHAIVRRTGGAVRDALVMLDQARMVSSGGTITLDTLQPLGFCDPSIFIEFLLLWQQQKSDEMIQLFRKWAPLIGPEAFLKGLEDTLYREILTAVGVEASRSERRAMLRLTMFELWQCIQRVWKVIDQAHLDLGRVEVTLICTLLKLGEEPSRPAASPTSALSASSSPSPVSEEKYREPSPPPAEPEVPEMISGDEMESLLNG